VTRAIIFVVAVLAAYGFLAYVLFKQGRQRNRARSNVDSDTERGEVERPSVNLSE